MRFHKREPTHPPATMTEEVPAARRETKETRRSERRRETWNLYVALYCKPMNSLAAAKGPLSFDSCFLWISFFPPRQATLNTSVAQIFTTRDGVVRSRCPDAGVEADRQPHLSINDAAELVIRALSAYRQGPQALPRLGS